LVGCAAHATALDLETGTRVLERTQHKVYRITFLQLLGDLLKGSVDNTLGKVLLAVLHDHVDEVSDQRAVVTDIRNDLAFLCSVTA
jgi:hypothetical protein